MNVDDQTAVIDFLASPAAHGGARVERIDTHAAVVFLAGDRAWKLKRAVRFDYLDFSTTDLRRASCEAEVRLNRRTAPDLYLGARAVTREPDGSLALDGAGAPVDWVVEMQRFDQELLCDRLAAAGRLDLELMPPLATAIARFHEAAEVRPDHGGAAGMTWVIDGNASGFTEFGAGVLDPLVCARMTDKARAELARCASLLDERRRAGRVRHCHGDLHLRNIVVIDGRPTLFDGVEFNDEIACIDVLYDLAFLLMDLWRRELPRHANVVLNRYLAESLDLQGIRTLPLFLSCRAAVRAKTSATSARFQKDARQRGDLEDTSRQYLAMGEQFLNRPQPCLMAIGGLSGSGKSTLAMRLAPSIGAVPGAVVIRSDEIRKELSGVDRLDRLGAPGYAAEVTARVYAAMAERAAAVLGAGHSAIVDAVHARPSDRAAIEQVAAGLALPFVGVWLDAPEATLVERVERRRHDASDADAAVVRRQRMHDVGTIGWHRVDAAAPVDNVRQAALAMLRAKAPGAAFEA